MSAYSMGAYFQNSFLPETLLINEHLLNPNLHLFHLLAVSNGKRIDFPQIAQISAHDLNCDIFTN